ncbi:LysR family transcriptional regulator [Novosphingobium sp. SG720]|uniref:LysR family transcriptional regulator n=1 Tax=Novosphingobium sp. SG720 TaxID=2586998 RepID=UPI0014485CCC|nr:LysR family transcriptional regulator [Novosphingobium sp. SG720]NKJ44773.1 DNA-binding transcriptional LysR family regulator [Novosphingobium sp. SG720]
MDFDERELKAFLAVAECGSLGRASRQANLTQPALSRLVQRMEERLQQPLFDRTTRGMVLTDPGALLLRHARHLLAEMDTLRDELAAYRGLRRGVVRVGAAAAVMRTLVATHVGRMLADNPDLTFEAMEDVDSGLVRALEQRLIDLAITSGRVEDDAEDVLCLGQCDHTDLFAVFCAADHPIADSPDLASVFAQGWVMPDAGMTPRTRFDALARQLGHQARVVARTSSVETMIAIAGASRLLCWLPVPLLAPYVAGGQLRRLDVPALETQRQFWVYRRRAGLLPDAARFFLRYMPVLPPG